MQTDRNLGKGETIKDRNCGPYWCRHARQTLGLHARLEMGQPHHLETNPFGLRHLPDARIEDWAHAVSPKIKPPLARPRTFIEAFGTNQTQGVCMHNAPKTFGHKNGTKLCTRNHLRRKCVMHFMQFIHGPCTCMTRNVREPHARNGAPASSKQLYTPRVLLSRGLAEFPMVLISARPAGALRQVLRPHNFLRKMMKTCCAKRGLLVESLLDASPPFSWAFLRSHFLRSFSSRARIIIWISARSRME